MPDVVDDFVPMAERSEMRGDPEVPRKLMRQVLDWLTSYAGSCPEAEQRRLARLVGIRAGLYGAEYPVDFGGCALPEQVLAELRETASASGVPFAERILTSDDGPSRLLMDATPEQQHTWLRPLVEGRLTRCLAMTEHDAGSDLSALRTTATRIAHGWRLSGRKFLISNAAEADVAIVLATAVDGAVSGPTFFLFRTDVPGWRVVRRLPGMNPRLNPYEVEIDSIEVTDEAVIGGPGRIGGGTGMALEWMAHGRVAIAARAVGLSRWALGVARRHAHDRIVDGASLSEKQYIREFIVRSQVKVEAARSLVRTAAAALDDGQLGAREAAVAKLFATESACEVIDDAIQVLGGRGWLAEYGLIQAYGEARMFRLVDGASELMKETIFHLLPAEADHRKVA